VFYTRTSLPLLHPFFGLVVLLGIEDEIREVKEWCRKRKQELKRTYIIERNPFRERFSWLKNKVFIEIDRPKEIANKMSLVYDSTTDTLWEYVNGTWRQITGSTVKYNTIRIDR